MQRLITGSIILTKMKIFIENNPLYFNELKFIFSLFAFNKKIDVTYVNSILDSELSIGESDINVIKIASQFYLDLRNGVYSHYHHFSSKPLIENSDGSPDYLSTAFYLVSCAQEIGSDTVDKFGRFEFNSSLQKRFNLSERNVVQECFDNLMNIPGMPGESKNSIGKSRIFLSHDIDTIKGSLLQDGFYALKKFRPDLLISIFMKNILAKPSWLNMDRIMKIESEAEFKSTFYWLVNKGKVDERLSNSDYNINDTKVQFEIQRVANSGWENGLHKSAADDSFEIELKKLNVKVIGNRYHYLKFTPENDFEKIEAAGLLFDSSLGFVEKIGFRNCYGQPFRPYNFKMRKAFNFIECPLNIMDTTFHNYLKLDAKELVKSTIQFCEKHKHESVLSVLFHNNYISDFKYKNYLSAFKELLDYFHESGLNSISQKEIVKEYYYEY